MEQAAPPGRRRPGTCLWLTGLSGAGKTTVSDLIRQALDERGILVDFIDGDEARRHLSAGLGFSREDRETNIRRIAWVSSRLVRAGAIVIVAAISPYRDAREWARREIDIHGRFIEVYVSAPLEVCEARDVKGLYARARAGEITGLTGLDDPYEIPEQADLILRTAEEPPQASASRALVFLDQSGCL